MNICEQSGNMIGELSEDEFSQWTSINERILEFSRLEHQHAGIVDNTEALNEAMLNGMHWMSRKPGTVSTATTRVKINIALANLLSSLYGYKQCVEKMPETAYFNDLYQDFLSTWESYRDSDDREFAFIWNLRHYYNHTGHPIEGIAWKSKRMSVEKPQIITSIKVYALRDRLLSSEHDWRNGIDSYLEGCEEQIEVLPMIARTAGVFSELHISLRAKAMDVIKRQREGIQDKYALLTKPGQNLFLREDNGPIDINMHFHDQFMDRLQYFLDEYSASLGYGTYYALCPEEYIVDL